MRLSFRRFSVPFADIVTEPLRTFKRLRTTRPRAETNAFRAPKTRPICGTNGLRRAVRRRFSAVRPVRWGRRAVRTPFCRGLARRDDRFPKRKRLPRRSRAAGNRHKKNAMLSLCGIADFFIVFAPKLCPLYAGGGGAFRSDGRQNKHERSGVSSYTECRPARRADPPYAFDRKKSAPQGRAFAWGDHSSRLSFNVNLYSSLLETPRSFAAAFKASFSLMPCAT